MRLFFILSLKIYITLTFYLFLGVFLFGNVVFILEYQEFFITGLLNPVILKVIFFTGAIPSVVLGYISSKRFYNAFKEDKFNK